MERVMADERSVALYDAWDAVNNAIRRILTAQPDQMTEAARRLDEARSVMDEVVRKCVV